MESNTKLDILGEKKVGVTDKKKEEIELTEWKDVAKSLGLVSKYNLDYIPQSDKILTNFALDMRQMSSDRFCSAKFKPTDKNALSAMVCGKKMVKL